MKLDERMKYYESQFNTKLNFNEPVIARIDGKCFHTLTRKVKKPFSPELVKIMGGTTKYLVQETNADLGYCQSDEISLIWLTPNKINYDGRVNKYNSILASMTTAYFNQLVSLTEPFGLLNKLALFDCRVWNVPNQIEAANYFYWRELDAIKNAITLAASNFYSHKQLLNRNSEDKINLLKDKGIDFWEEYSYDFIRGQYFKKYQIERFTPWGDKYIRNECKKCTLPLLKTLEDKTIIFGE